MCCSFTKGGDTVYRSAVVVCLLFFGATVSVADPGVPEGMVLIPGSVYEMGTDESELEGLAELGRDVPHMNQGHAVYWFGDETPVHTVSVDSFYMDAYEITNREFREFVEETGFVSSGDWERFAAEGLEDYPVVAVTWDDAEAYAEWAGKRLPTEEEWEYACAGGEGHQFFYWGDEPEQGRANYRFFGESFFAGLGRLMGFRNLGTSQGGSYPPNGNGLFDMLGNVSEWVDAEYRPYPGFTWSVGPWNNESDFSRKVARGGNWNTPNAVFLRTACRLGFPADSFSWDRGFRCAASI